MAGFSFQREFFGCCLVILFSMFMLWRWLDRFHKGFSYLKPLNSSDEDLFSDLEIRSDKALIQNKKTHFSKFWNNITDASFVRIQQKRKHILKEACERKSGKQLNMLYEATSHSLYSKTYNFSVCVIHKCGYSSWLAAFLVMENIYTWKDHGRNLTRGSKAIRLGEVHFNIKKLYRNNQLLILKKWNESIKVITVRNPFSRLLSAYNDKFRLHSKGRTYSYAKMGRAIEKVCRHLRHKVTERNRIFKTPRFEDFINFLVRFSPRRVDPHWKSYHNVCFPCNTDFDIIIKFETLKADIGNLTQILGLPSNHKMAVFPHRPYKTTEAMVKEAFQSLPKSLVQLLYNKYKFDFKLFGYERPSWLG